MDKNDPQWRTGLSKPDPVEFEAEDGTLRGGAVISIHSLESEVTYLIEPGSEPWGDVVVPQSRMTLVE